MGVTQNFAVFVFDGQRYALYLSAVDRVIRAVEITSLPKAPDIVIGVINAQGRIIPVVNVRRRFGLPDREMTLSDHIIIAQTSKRPVAMVVDAVTGVIEHPEEAPVPANTILPDMPYVEGVLKLADGLILIHDLDRFLSLEEERSLDAAMGDA